MSNPVERFLGKTKVDSLFLDSAAWYIDGEQVTASATDLNSGSSSSNSSQIIYDIYNSTGGVLTAGTPLHINGYSTGYDCFTVEKSNARTEMPCQLFAQHDIAASTKSTASIEYTGTGNGLDCTGAAVGDPVYLSGTSGRLTLTMPAEPNTFVQIVGRVASQTNPGKLVLDARFQEMSKISGLQISPKAFSGFSTVAPDMAADCFVISDATDNTNKTVLGTLLAEGLAGSGLTASNGQLSVTSSGSFITPGTIITKYSGELDMRIQADIWVNCGRAGVDGTVIGVNYIFTEAPNVTTSLKILKVDEDFIHVPSVDLTEQYSNTAANLATITQSGIIVGATGSDTPDVLATDILMLSCPYVAGRTSGKVHAYVMITAW
jgi:hypothetical protein